MSYLFVYGTLRKGFAHPMARFLAERARHVEAAKAPGRLYDLGLYPGMLEPAAPDDWVHGDLFELTDDEATLKALDHYESLHAQPPMFERVSGDVVTATGETMRAWYYLYRRVVSEAQRLASGDWWR